MMRSLIISICLLIARGVIAQDASAYYMVIDGAPVYNYLIAEDFSGNGNDGTCSSANILEFVSGDWQGNFDGSSEYIQNGTNLFTSTEQGTFSAWVKLNSDIPNATSQTIMGFGGPDGATDPLLAMGIRKWAALGNIQYLDLTYADGNESGIDGVSGTTTVFTSGVWHHVAVTSDGSSYYLYLDGVPQSKAVWIGSDDGNWTADLAGKGVDFSAIGAGKYQGSKGGYFDGLIKDVLEYDTEINATGIAAIYNGTNAPNSTVDITMQPKEVE